MITNKKQDYMNRPGYFLKSTLNEYSMTQKDLSNRIGLSEKQIVSILKGNSPITPETAQKLESVFGISAGYWNDLQKQHDEAKARLEAEEKWKEEITTLNNFSVYKELSRYGYVPKTNTPVEKVGFLQAFFGVSSLKNIDETYSLSFQYSQPVKEPDQYSLISWLRCGEIEFRKEPIPDYDSKLLKNTLDQIKALSTKKFDLALKELKKSLMRAGLFFTIVPYFEKTYIDGVVGWIGENPIIQLSNRYKYQDIFWFTVFHEICHVLKHKKKKYVIFEFENKNENEEEIEADKFACDTLIPEKVYHKFIGGHDYSVSAIKRFAKSISVRPCIVAGRLCSDGFAGWNSLEPLRDKIETKDLR